MTHTILVAFAVNGRTMAEAQKTLMDRLPNPAWDCHETIDCWWIAHDDSEDGSDNDSAVFVDKGREDEAVAILRAAGLQHG